MTAGELEPGNQPDGELFRAELVYVTSPSQKKIHTGVMPESAIVAGLNVMLNEWRSPTASKLIAAIVCHLIFEIVHPFYDGNGRTGRYILVHHLSQVLSLPTALSMSSIILGKKEAYYKQFTEVEHPLNRGECTSFIEFMLDAICAGQDDLLGSLRAKRFLINDYAETAATLAPDLLSQEMLVVLAQSNLFTTDLGVTLDTLASELGKSKQTIRSRLDELVSAGVVEIVKHKPLVVMLSESGAQTMRAGV